ncbi:hypothetical protein [Streptomyces sp. HGB0020]|uniref:hypothetical protein n=1 Tax=Streptomyces sp. HGB0020 TaxID=1078086 RepID=UPI0018F893A3|nr:hypothetical protein [Streptomyces sp. HGB0020]
MHEASVAAGESSPGWSVAGSAGEVCRGEGREGSGGGLDRTQRRGVVDCSPGLYFVGRLFQYAVASSMIQGVGRDAEHVVRHLVARSGPAARGRNEDEDTAALGGGRSGA